MLLLPLVLACGESKQDTGLDEDTAACETDVEIVTVCENDLSLDWSATSYSVSSVWIVGLRATALETKEALCDGSFIQADIAFTITQTPEDGTTEHQVDALEAPVAVGLFDSAETVATLILDPDAEESNCTVVFD